MLMLDLVVVYNIAQVGAMSGRCIQVLVAVVWEPAVVLHHQSQFFLKVHLPMWMLTRISTAVILVQMTVSATCR